MTHSTIILIGPMSAGKTTIAPLLAEKLGLEHCALDEVRWDYYNEIGYDEAEVARISKAEGLMGRLRYWKPFEAHSVERVLADHHNCVVDFGAGHSVYEDESLLARVERALAPFPNVILLLPSPDLDESAKIVNARLEPQLQDEGVDVAAILAYTLAFVAVMLLIELLLVQPVERHATRWRRRPA